MRKNPRRRSALWINVSILFVAAVIPAGAQTAVVLYVDDPVEVVVSPAEDEYALIDIGQRIPAGSTIETANTSIELQLEPSGAIVYISPDTLFMLDTIDVGPQTVDHRFSLRHGKMRMVVSAFLDDSYEVTTPSAVLGVRGTDFTQRVVPGETDWVCVRQGEVTFRRLRDSRIVRVASGAFADARDRRFVPEPISRERLEEIFSDVQFRRLDPEIIRDLRERISEIDVREVLENARNRMETTADRVQDGVGDRLNGVGDRLQDVGDRLQEAGERTRDRLQPEDDDPGA